MNTHSRSSLLVLASLLFSVPAFGNHVILSGQFDGSEPQIAPFSGTCGAIDLPGDDTLGYVELGPLQVSSTGLYEFADAGEEVALDVVIRVYEEDFDPQSPSANLVASSVDRADRLPLKAGVAYVVVLQHWCNNLAGTYGVAVSGGGTVSGQGTVEAAAYTFGSFDGGDSVAEFGFGESIYDINGPIQVPETGEYHFADVSRYWRTDVQLWVYDGPFNPEDPGENAAGFLEDEGTVELEANNDYYFVTTPRNDNEYGEWQYVLFPPGSPRFNGFFSGSWNNGDIPKQGIMLEVMPEIDFVFFVWFTFEQQQAVLESGGGLPKLNSLGGEGQRWFSGFGTYTPGASSVTLAYENTTGGTFMSSVEPDQDTDYGTGTLRIVDCNHLVIEYDLPSGPVQGSYPVSRVYPDAVTVAACEEIGNQAGVIE